METKPRTWLKPTDQMDVWLDTQGYYRKHTARDTSCLFRAVSEQVFLTQALHSEVKRQILDYILIHKRFFEKLIGGPVDEYVDKMKSPREWGGPIEIKAMALYYKIDFIMFKNIGALGEPATDFGYKRRLMLCQSQERHYDSVYTKDYITDSAFCQSIIYDLLYKNVFKLKEVDYAVKKMLHDKTTKFQREHVPFYGNCFDDLRLEMRDSSSNVKDLLDMGITPFPYKVAKSLDIEVYRNVEFDIWNDYRKGLRYGLCPWNCKELQVGVKCLVKINNSNYHGHIQEMQPKKGPVLVFVLELGEKISVPYESLELLPPPTPSQQSPSTNRMLSLRLQTAAGLESKLKESGESVSNVGIEEPRDFTQEPQVVSSSNYYEEDGEYIQMRYENMFHQEDGVHEDHEVYPDSTKPGIEQNVPLSPTVKNSQFMPYSPSLVEQNAKPVRPVNLMAPRSFHTDGSDLPHTDTPPEVKRNCYRDDIQTLRFFYNLGLDHMRMNCLMRPPPYYVNPGVIPSPNYVTIDSPVTPIYEHQAPAPLPPTAVIDATYNPHESPSSESESSQAAIPPRFKKKVNPANAVKRNSQAYEGQPLIQQYEVSSSSVHPMQTVYYQPMECEAPLPPPPPPYCPVPVQYVDYPVYDFTPPYPPPPIAYPAPPFVQAVETPIYYQPILPHPPPI